MVRGWSTASSQGREHTGDVLWLISLVKKPAVAIVIGCNLMHRLSFLCLAWRLVGIALSGYFRSQVVAFKTRCNHKNMALFICPQ